MAMEREARVEGVVLLVRARPGARSNAVTGVRSGALMVAVTPAAEKGKANAAIIKVLCAALGLRRAQLTLIAGETSSQKKFLVTDISPSELQERVAAALPS